MTQRVRELVSEANNVTLAIVITAFVLVLFIILPRVIPVSSFGVRCSALAHPIGGGNNQSLLSARSEGALQLQIDVQRSNIAANEPLVVNVTFNNTGVGAINLFFVPEEALLRDDGAPGLSFLIERIPDRTIFSEPANVRPPNPQRQSFPMELLHVVGPKQRCTEQITFNTIRLNSMGLTPGTYSIRAVYRNPFAGTLNVPPNATATPIFSTQGVYVTNELRSNEVQFTIGAAVQQAPGGEAPPLGG